MNSDLNIATRRLLQIVLDMLRKSDAEMEAERAKAKSNSYSNDPVQWRCEIQCVEAAWRAAKEAQEMLAVASADREGAGEEEGEPLTPAERRELERRFAEQVSQ